MSVPKPLYNEALEYLTPSGDDEGLQLTISYVLSLNKGEVDRQDREAGIEPMDRISLHWVWVQWSLWNSWSEKMQ